MGKLGEITEQLKIQVKSLIADGITLQKSVFRAEVQRRQYQKRLDVMVRYLELTVGLDPLVLAKAGKDVEAIRVKIIDIGKETDFCEAVKEILKWNLQSENIKLDPTALRLSCGSLLASALVDRVDIDPVFRSESAQALGAPESIVKRILETQDSNDSFEGVVSFNGENVDSNVEVLGGE